MSSHHIYVIMIIISILGIVYSAAKAETQEANNKDSFMQKAWNNDILSDEKCMDYLNMISSYPHWRLCAIFAFMMSFILTPIVKLIEASPDSNESKNKLNTFVLQFTASFLVIFIACVKLIDYFRWHVMCGGWGCTGH